jgi:hypothetical protein
MAMTCSKSLACALAAGLLAAGLGACDDESSDSAALGAQELVSQARAVCREHNDAIDAAAAGLPRQPSPAEIRRFVERSVVPEYTAWIEALDELEPPADLAIAWDAWIADSYATRDAIAKDPGLALDPDAQEFANVNGQAEALGLGRVCYAGPTA